MTEKPRTPFIAATRAQGFIVAVLAMPLAIFAGLFTSDDARGDVAGIAFASIGLLIFICWPLRNKPWFWIAVTIFGAVHAFAIAHFDWSFTHSWSGRAMTSLMYPDIAIMIGIIYIAYRLKYGAPTELVDDAPDDTRYGERDLDL